MSPLGNTASNIDGVLSMMELYGALANKISDNAKSGKKLPGRIGLAGGVGWAVSGGEAAQAGIENCLAVDGIHNVIQALEEIEDGKLADLDFFEGLACNGGCVGGTLNVENPYIAKARLQSLRRYLPVSLNHIPQMEPDDALPTDVLWDTEVSYTPVTRLSANRAEAMRKMAQIQEIRESLCDLDCGSCGAPTCQALAEDIVKGEASPDDCIIRLRQKLAEGKSEK